MEVRSVPAFYCCYLLRSTIRHQALYVGSTPDPVRRLAQHNGISKGGAVRTSRLSLRPWEMVAVVSGFPSKIAALQFEWAWQNTHLSLRIPEGERITERKTVTKIYNGRARKKPARPRLSMVDKLSNVHLLLAVDSFARMPLHLRFFNKDVYKRWNQWVAANHVQVRPGVEVLFDPPIEDTSKTSDPVSKSTAKGRAGQSCGGIGGLDVGFASFKQQLERTMEIVAEQREAPCSVCLQQVNLNVSPTLFCTSPDCTAASHLRCLAQHFRKQDSGLGAEALQDEIFIPFSGPCPACFSTLSWSDLIKEYSIRARDPVLLQKLLKKPKEKKPSTQRKKTAVMSSEYVDEEETTADQPGVESDDMDDAAMDDFDSNFADQASSVDGDAEAVDSASAAEEFDIDNVDLRPFPRAKRRSAFLVEDSEPET